ncbi:Oxidoreductase, short-chain dehydrogenase/reductase family [Olavius sp. associated proteobacterium Delta 1]|nr:Oxidoreductase, short-chain dehydrogenase/reductase family [Olavius sp. associated proteobacterium Delta 1]
MRFKDKAVVVTGGATGIGRAMCLRFAREGAAVVINYSKSKTDADEVVSEIEGAGGRALAVQADVSIDRQARNLISKSVDHFGRLDLLINNAGWTRFIPHHDLESLSDEVLENTWAVIVKGSIYCIRAAVPQLKAAGDASIINTTSIAAYSARGSSLIYVAAKSALAGITKALARALAPEIRVNAIAPGFVDTGFVNWTPEVLEELQKPTRLGRKIVPEEIADAALYLAADAKSTTGQTILVDAGDAALG